MAKSPLAILLGKKPLQKIVGKRPITKVIKAIIGKKHS
jgi:hypothetical protein